MAAYLHKQNTDISAYKDEMVTVAFYTIRDMEQHSFGCLAAKCSTGVH